MTVIANLPGVAQKPWYRHRWPWLLMAGPAWVLAAGAFVGYLAYTRPDAMVVDDYYAKGKAINQDLRRDASAAARGIDVALAYQAEGNAGATLAGTVSAKGLPLAGPLQLRLIHPTQPARDITVAVVAAADGTFSAHLPLLEPTRWQVQIEGGGRDWRLMRQWERPAVGSRLVLGAAGAAQTPQ